MLPRVYTACTATHSTPLLPCQNLYLSQINCLPPFLFSSRWYLCARKSPWLCAPPSLRSFPNTVCLNDYGPLLSYQGRSSSTSSFHTSLLQVINGVMSLALCSKIVSQVPQHLTLPRCKPLVMVALPASLSAWSFPFTPACPGRYTHRSFERWMSVIDTFQSGLPIPLFDFCSKFIESVRMTACVVWLSPLEAIQGVWLLPPPSSSWRLRLYRLHCVYGWWSHLAWQ